MRLGGIVGHIELGTSEMVPKEMVRTVSQNAREFKVASQLKPEIAPFRDKSPLELYQRGICLAFSSERQRGPPRELNSLVVPPPPGS